MVGSGRWYTIYQVTKPTTYRYHVPPPTRSGWLIYIMNSMSYSGLDILVCLMWGFSSRFLDNRNRYRRIERRASWTLAQQLRPGAPRFLDDPKTPITRLLLTNSCTWWQVVVGSWCFDMVNGISHTTTYHLPLRVSDGRWLVLLFSKWYVTYHLPAPRRSGRWW